MAHKLKPLDRLKGEQLIASDPSELVWLSASAGTGKTHVLSARVLRLLLRRVRPETILCLTFTKAGAAEMAERVHSRLARWARLKETELAGELVALGEEPTPERRALARTLFAEVLDAPGGGLRIQTIHAFCQTLLGAFPAEAGLAPGFRPIEPREEGALARRTLAELIDGAERGGALGLIADVQRLSRRLGEGGAESYLMQCARAPEAMAALASGIAAKVRTGLGVPLGDVEAAIVAAVSDGAFALDRLRAVAAANAAWGTKSGLERADTIARWITGSPATRAAMLGELHAVWAKADGAPRSFGKGQAPQDEDYAGHCGPLCEGVGGLLALRVRAALADLLAAGLRAGQAFARAYAEAKRAAGVVDFDDLVRLAEALLRSDGAGDWIRYKLDQATDHILVDEAQDTNARQWAIVAALADEFFAGEGARGSRHRTIFTVGDRKQAIFGFQGTDPIAFSAAGMHFTAKAEGAGRAMRQLSLDRSFRSTPPVLALVDRLLEELGPEQLGLERAAAQHVSARGGPGTVTLWRPLSAETAGGDEEEGEEGWADDATRAFAARLARQIAAWLADPFALHGKRRPLRPEDIMVLVRRRGDLASLLVARLHAEGVPVAGVDRLRLNAPLAVRDLLALLRFALQPEDDLSLAGVLVSPLFGLEQDDLYRVGFGREGSLWRALRGHPEFAGVAGQLGDILAAADFTSPYRLLERVLSGPLEGRRKLIARLGHEARDPIEELLNAALAFESESTPSLQRFLDWFDRGDVEITRDPSAPLDAVRVMTVHGAKGLQAPVVILADATGDPDRSPRRGIDWAIDPEAPGRVPLFRPRKEELADSLAEELALSERRERQEHWRLLYVAATRAEERLIVGGALGPRAKGVPPAQSWYQAIDRALEGLGAAWEEDPLWSGARHHRGGEAAAVRARTRTTLPPPAEPAWLHRAAPQETRPPRPLAPSAIGLDAVADPPPSAGLAEAARRGSLLHALFERLPAVAPDRRQAAALAWLDHSAGVTEPVLREELAAAACAIIGDPAHAALFAPGTLAEAPIAAVVDGVVVAGTVDRLCVTDTAVRVVDFKTGRRVPRDLAAVPELHLHQMGAYAAALAVIFPGRSVDAALLYTAGPRLIVLPPVLLAGYKPRLTG